MGMLHTYERIEERASMPGGIPVESLYTAGIAGELFFRALRDEGRILASRCEKCSTRTLLPRAFCERCLQPTASYDAVDGAGEVRTFTIARRDLEGRPLENPEILALVGYAGIEGGIIHKLRDVRGDEVEVGMRVEPVFRGRTEREGSILDISHFRPA